MVSHQFWLQSNLSSKPLLLRSIGQHHWHHLWTMDPPQVYWIRICILTRSPSDFWSYSSLRCTVLRTRPKGRTASLAFLLGRLKGNQHVQSRTYIFFSTISSSSSRLPHLSEWSSHPFSHAHGNLALLSSVYNLSPGSRSLISALCCLSPSSLSPSLSELSLSVNWISCSIFPNGSLLQSFPTPTYFHFLHCLEHSNDVIPVPVIPIPVLLW